MSLSYGVKDISTLEGMEAIRHRPGMFIGSVGQDGVNHITLEIISNAIDEYLAGYCNEINVSVLDSGVSVTDNGRGVPFGKAEDGSETLVNIFTKLHTGAKFSLKEDSGYNSSGGMNGVGSKATNALSKTFSVISIRENGIAKADFKKGELSNYSVEKNINKKPSGTTVVFLPDEDIFKETNKVDIVFLEKTLKEFSFLCNKLKITFNAQGKEKVFYSENGISDYINDLSPKQLTKKLICSKKNGKTGVNIGMVYNESNTEKYKIFTNNIPNTSGTHLTGFKTALTRAVNKIARENGLLKEKDENLAGEDIRDGLVAVISLTMQNPVFSGQTKEVLTSSEGRQIVESLLLGELENYLRINEDDLKIIVNKALINKKAREAAKKAREAVREKSKTVIKSKLPGKLTDCIKKDPQETELFLVEGESAASSAKAARDKHTQAIMALRGKVLNTQSINLTKALTNQEIKDMITILGTGVANNFNYEKLRYDKIIFLCDGDVDGSHIQILLLTFFFKFLPDLIKNGNVYLAMPPLYKAVKAKGHTYLLDDLALSEYQKEEKNKYELYRFKGLGEMDATELKETTMDKSKRRLKQVTISDAENANEMFEALMGKKADSRKEFLAEYGHLAEINI